MRSTTLIAAAFTLLATFSAVLGLAHRAGPYSIYDSTGVGYAWLREHGIVSAHETLMPWEDPVFDCNGSPNTILVVVKRPVEIENIESCKIVILSENASLLREQLSKLGLNVDFHEAPIIDLLFNHGGNESLVKAWGPEGQALIMREPYAVRGSSARLEPLAVTSPFSFVDADLDGMPGPIEPKGPFIVGACAGNLCFFADADFLTRGLAGNSTISLIESLGGDFVLVYDTPPSITHYIIESVELISGYVGVIIVTLHLLFSLVRRVSLGGRRDPLRVTVYTSLAAIVSPVIAYFMSGDWLLTAVIALSAAWAAYGNMMLTAYLASWAVSVSYGPLPGLLAGLALGSLATALLYYRKVGISRIAASSTLVSLPLAMSPQGVFGLLGAVSAYLAAAGASLARLQLANLRVEDSIIEVSIGDERETRLIKPPNARIVDCRASSETGVASARCDNHRLIVRGRATGRDTILLEIDLEDYAGLARATKLLRLEVLSVPLLEKAWRAYAVSHPAEAMQIARAFEEALRAARMRRGGITRINIERESLTGEYAGARLYAPGDRPRDIYWKKSLAKGVLIVKKYAGEEEFGVHGGADLGIIVIADFYSYGELDSVVSRLLGLLASLDNVARRVALVVARPPGEVFAASGSPREIAGLLLYSTLKTAIVRNPSGPRVPAPKSLTSIGRPHPLGSIAWTSYHDLAREVLEALQGEGIKRGAPLLVAFGFPAAPGASIVSSLLEETGFQIVSPGVTT